MTIRVRSASVRRRTSGPATVKSATLGGVVPGRVRWGGWGSNPGPSDYENYGPMRRARQLRGYRVWWYLRL